LEITLGFETYRLTSGDSISFDSSRPHRLANAGDVPVEAIWVNLELLDHE
jgi:mannose-6-phosphate isomerase-like protein (cupin superfamily)